MMKHGVQQKNVVLNREPLRRYMYILYIFPLHLNYLKNYYRFVKQFRFYASNFRQLFFTNQMQNYYADIHEKQIQYI